MSTINNPHNFLTTEDQWWMIYETETKEIIIEPQQCYGYTSSPFTVVIGDTKEELEQYILENGLFIKSPDSPNGMID